VIRLRIVSPLRLLPSVRRQSFLFLFLLRLQRLPVAAALRRKYPLSRRQNTMRMPVHQFVRKPVEHINPPRSGLLHLPSANRTAPATAGRPIRQSVPANRDCRWLPGLVGLFQRVGLNGVEGLFAIPRASARSPQSRHDLNRSLESFACGGHPVQCKRPNCMSNGRYARVSSRACGPQKFMKIASSIRQNGYAGAMRSKSPLERSRLFVCLIGSVRS